MEQRHVWLRLGVTVNGSPDEIESLFSQSEAADATLAKILKEGRYKIEYDTYIPEPSVEQYNASYGTNHVVGDYEIKVDDVI